MEDISKWILGGLVALLGVVALFVAAGAEEPVAYWGGLAFFAFAVLLVMTLIHRAYAHGGNQPDLPRD